MKNKNTKRMLKIYSLALATSLLFSSSKEGLNKSENIQEYPWAGGVLSEEELVHKKKVIYTKKGRKL